MKHGIEIPTVKTVNNAFKNNLPSARGRENESFISDYLKEECEKGRMIKTSKIGTWYSKKPVFIPVGIVKGRKTRMIEHFSYPRVGGSVNDALLDVKKTVAYPLF